MYNIMFKLMKFKSKHGFQNALKNVKLKVFR